MEIRSSSLSRSLSDMTALYEKQSIDLIRFQTKLKTMTRVVVVLGIVLVVRYVGMVVGFVLYAKGVRLPRWLDILL